MHALGIAGALGASIAGALAARLNTLAEHLVHPVLADPMLTSRPHARLVLTVPGALAGLPWSMLPGFVGRVITIPTSASRWLAQQRASEGADAAAPRSAGFIAGPAVTRAADEVARSASAWQHSSVLTGSSAISTAAAALAGEVSVLHLATHGRHAAENPFFSGVELADGPWFGYDVEQLERVPALVVLSACEVGRSSVNWGQESLGMTRTWLQAGADCVIASATNVNDDVASDLFPAVHKLLADGIPPAVALAAATQSTGHITSFIAHGSGW